MDIISYFARRPVIATALSILVFLAGTFALLRLPVSLFPAVELDTVTVSAHYPGAAPSLMDNRVVSEILSAVSGIKGIDYTTSESTLGYTTINLNLNVGANVQDVLSQVSENVRAISSFPSDMDPVQVQRKQVDSAPDFAVAFVSNQMTAPEVYDYLDRVIKPQLEAMSGVGSVDVLGSRYAMRIWLDPARLERYGLTVLDIRHTLRANNVQINAGTERSGMARASISVGSGLKSVEDFRDLPTGSGSVRLGDVARIELGARQPNVRSRFDGHPATVIFVHWRKSANPLVVGKKALALLSRIQPDFPYDLHHRIMVNSTDYIRTAIREVATTILITAAIVMAVIFLGTGALRAVAIPVIVIPLSLVGICAVMELAGFSINTLTLLAMVLAIGLVVDDAIVVLDMSVAGMRQGLTPMDAAISGTRTIAASLLSMTLTLAVAYLPVAFMGGLVSKLFTQFAVTLAGAVVLSGVIAVTLTPLMCGKILLVDHARQPRVRRIEALFLSARRCYQRSLLRVLRFRSLLLWIWAFCLATAAILYFVLPRGLAPTEDQGNLMVLAEAPISTNIDFIYGQARRLENIYRDLPGVKNYNYVAGVPTENRLISFIRLKNWRKRSKTAMQLQPMLQLRLADIPALHSVVIVPTSLPGAGGLPFQFVLKQQNSDYRMLDALSDTVLRRLRRSGLFLFARKNLNLALPQLRLHIDRQRAADYGVSTDALGLTVSLAYANARLQPFTFDGQTYDVVMQLDPSLLRTSDPLAELMLRTDQGKLIRASDLTNQSTHAVPAELNRFQGRASVTISGVLAQGVGLSQAVSYLQHTIKAFKPRGVTTDLAGATRRSAQENTRQQWTFLDLSRFRAAPSAHLCSLCFEGQGAFPAQC